MSYFLMALFCSLVGFLPLFAVRRFALAGFLTAIGTPLLWFIFWASKASTIGPYFGDSIYFAGFFIIVSVVIDFLSKEGETLTVWFLAVFLVPAVLWFFLANPMFHSDEYVKLIGTMDEKVWTQDVQPKDPKHLKYTSLENALYRAKNSLTKNGKNLGSQFEIIGATQQKTNKGFEYVVILDFKDSYGIWSNVGTVPAYITVSADNDEAMPEIVELPKEKQFRYTPHAFFDKNLERHVRSQGFLDKGFAETSLEIDPQDKAWWVITTYSRVVWNSGKKIDGVIIVDPVSGDAKPYKLGEIPEWADRVMPAEIVKDYLSDWGYYKSGFMNTLPIIGGKDPLLKPEEPNLIYGDSGYLEMVVGMTSNNEKDTSLVSYVYVDSRTGKATHYQTNGGSTDEAIAKAVINNQFVSFKKLHPVDLQTYNMYGAMTSFMPLLNDSHARQGIALVNVRNIEQVATGENLTEALHAYQKMIGSREKSSIEKSRQIAEVSGKVLRVHPEYKPEGTIYRLYIEDFPHILVGENGVSKSLPITEKGDVVSVKYYDSHEEEIPMYQFVNRSVSLAGTETEEMATAKAQKTIEGERQQLTANTVQEKMKNLTPEQLQKIEDFLR